MTSVSWDDTDQSGSKVAPALRWKGRTHINFVAGRSKLRALPVVVHLLPDDIDWFGKDPSLFNELKSLIRDHVIAATNGGDRDGEAPKSRKRARKEELCVQGDRLQFTYRYRKTLPRYTVLTYADDNIETNIAGFGPKNPGHGSPGFTQLPLSQSTLLVWVYRFDIDDPYRYVPNEAALQFTPSAKTSAAKALDVEAIGRHSRASTGATGVQAGPRDAGLLMWLWGGHKGDEEGCLGGSSAGGAVRQHFIGSAAWQGSSIAEPGRGRGEEENDIQRAIALSLQQGQTGNGGEGGRDEEDAVEVLSIDDGGVEESKGCG